MESKVVSWDFKKPDKLEVHVGMGLVEFQILRDAFVRQYREEIDNWLQPFLVDGWRLRYPIDGSILVTDGESKTNWFVAAIELGLAAFAGPRQTAAIHTYMVVKGYRVQLVKD